MSQQQVMTNLGPRRKGSARLEPLSFGRGSPPEPTAETPTALPDGRSPSAHLPPLNRSREGLADTFDTVLVDDVSPGISPVRRARKAALMNRSRDPDHRTVLQASLALDQKEREMALIRDNKREYGRILLELWVNQVLDPKSGLSSSLASTQGLGDPLKIDASALKGLAAYGLTRVELLGAGLSNEAIDRLYRCMYVYTVGFFDVMQDLLAHSEFRTEILSNVWKGFLTIAESALQVSFRSDYLKLYQSQQVAMAELLFAKEQLDEARQDSVNTEQAVAWLTNAHAEERAARHGLQTQLQELQAVLERERQAHQAAVTKYVAEVEERVRLQAQLVSATAKLSEAAVAQVDLVVQRDHLTSELAAAEQRALRIVDHVRGVYEALAMEKAIKPNGELLGSLESLLRTAASTAVTATEPSLALHGVDRSSLASLNPAVQGSESATASAAPTAPSSREPSRSHLDDAGLSFAPADNDASSTAAGAADGGGGGGGSDASASAWPLLPALDAPARAEATLLYTDLISDMTKQLYGMWREQIESNSTAVRSLFEVRDSLRASKLREYELQVELDKARQQAQVLQKTLTDTEGALRTSQANLHDTDETLAALRDAKAEVDRQAEELSRILEETRCALEGTQVERNTLLASSRVLHTDLGFRDQRISRLERRLAVATDSLAEVSRAMVVYAKAAAGQDIARGYFKKMYQEASKRAGDLQWSLFRIERQVRTLEGKIETKNSELANLATSSEAAKQQAEAVQTSLAGALMDIENKKAMISSLERALTSAKEDGAKLKAELEAATLRAEQAEQELEDAKEEIQRQADGMQSLEGRIAAAGEERSRLLKQVERLVNEKAEVERMSKQQRDSMQSEINRRGTEISSLRAEIEGLNLRIEGLTGELAHTREEVARKREKKRKWKLAQSQYQQQTDFLRTSLAEREGLVAELAARLEPLEVDVALLMADRGREPPSTTDDGGDTAELADQTGIDIVAEQQQWDEVTHHAHDLSNRLEAQQRNMEAARREYEAARANFYEAPTEESRKTALLGIEAVIAKLRVERAETEADLARLRDRQMAIQERLQAYENAVFKRRMAALERRTGKTEVALKNELITRLDESRQRNLTLQASVDHQSAIATTAQNRAARMEIDFIKTEAEMRDLADKLKKTIEFKVELERQLAQYKNMVGFLQAEVSSLSRERDALKTNLQEVDSKIERLTSDVSEAQSAIGITSKRLEAKYEAEKREAVAAALERQKQLEAKVALCEARIKELETVHQFANESLRRFVASTLALREVEVPPAFLWHINRPPHLQEALLACVGRQGAVHPASAGGTGASDEVVAGRPEPLPSSLGAALGRVSYSTNFDFERDTVLAFMSGCWSFDMTLVTISQVYVDKLQADLRAEEGLLGGVAGPRISLESILYEFFTSRYGCRPAAELHLGAFLAAVRKFRSQHPKVRTFARLLGLPEPAPANPGMAEDVLTQGPLPPPAVEFYLSLVNRIHARAGPLIAEAAEGFSLVKAKVLARLAREFLRGSFNTTLDDVAATPDYIRHMALNDEEKSIDLELALEAILRAFVMQYNNDLEALCATFRSSFEAVGRRLITPDDMAVFLRQLNAEKAAALPPSRALGLYVEAARAAGTNSESLGVEICRVVLNSGFVGISTHVTRHEPMRTLPPYDEFELLEESWRLMRVAVEQQVAVIKTRSEQIKCDVLAYVDLARRVDELVGGRDSAVPAWSTYRRLLTIYASNREAVDAILPFDPPTGTLRRAFTTQRHKHHTAAAPGQEGGGAGDGEGEEGGEGDGEGQEREGGGETDDSTSRPGSGANSRSASPLDRRRSARFSVSHKSLGAALSRNNSGELGGALPEGNSLTLTGEVRRQGRLLVPKGPSPTGAFSDATSFRSLAAKSRKPSGDGADGDGQEDQMAAAAAAAAGPPTRSSAVRVSAFEPLNASVVKLQFNGTAASRKSLTDGGAAKSGGAS